MAQYCCLENNYANNCPWEVEVHGRCSSRGIINRSILLQYHKLIILINNQHRFSTVWGPDKNWQCFRCYKSFKPNQMELNKTNKKWYCNTCINPSVVNTPYILTQEEISSISLTCSICHETFLTQPNSVLLENADEFICQKCK